jgi:uncharacterized cupin superfamily protein
VNEELFLVLGGEMSIRLNGREYPLATGDLVGLPPGPESAHQLLNRTDRPAHLLAASTMIPRDVIDYPDSAKRLYGVRDLNADPPAASVLLKEERVASYFDGEPAEELVAEVSPEGAGRDPRIVSLEDVPWERLPFGEPFGGECKWLARRTGARLLGYSLYRLQPGQRPWAFHLHHVNEEFFYVRSGHGQLRTKDGTLELEPGDAFACLPGPEGTHAIQNSGDGPLEYFALSTMEHPEVAEYPDSGKIYVFVGSAPGGDPEARALNVILRLADEVDYLEGER